MTSTVIEQTTHWVKHYPRASVDIYICSNEGSVFFCKLIHLFSLFCDRPSEKLSAKELVYNLAHFFVSELSFARSTEKENENHSIHYFEYCIIAGIHLK